MSVVFVGLIVACWRRKVDCECLSFSRFCVKGRSDFSVSWFFDVRIDIRSSSTFVRHWHSQSVMSESYDTAD